MRESTARLKNELGIKRHDVDQDVEAIEQRVGRARDRIDQTRMRIYNSPPSRAFNFFYSRFRRSPMGYLLLGAGLFRLSRNRSEYSSMDEYSARDRLRNIKSGTKEMMSESKEKMSGALDETRERAMSFSQRARNRAQMNLRKHPMLFVGFGFMAGSLLAVAFPQSRQEKEKVGPVVGRIQNRAAEKTKEQIHKVTESMK